MQAEVRAKFTVLQQVSRLVTGAGSPVASASRSSSSAADFTGGSAFDLLAGAGGDDDWDTIPVKATRKAEAALEAAPPQHSDVPGTHQGPR